MFAGIVALADQQAGHDLGLINPELYQMAAKHAPGIVPVTSGNSTVSFQQHGAEHTVTGYQASSGYSLSVGLGTIDAATFVPELATRSAPATRDAPPRPSVGHTPRFVDRGENIS